MQIKKLKAMLIFHSILAKFGYLTCDKECNVLPWKQGYVLTKF